MEFLWLIAPAMAAEGLPMPSANNPWWVVLAAALPSGVSGAWVIWQWWVNRDDKLHVQVLTREQQLMQDLDKQRAASDAAAANLADRTLAALNRAEAENAVVRRQRDDAWAGWDKDRIEKERQAELARVCHRAARMFRHDLKTARSTINVQREAQGLPPVDWPDDPLPSLDQSE